MAEETITLAPAAGAGVGKILADRLLAEPEFIDLMVDAAINGLKATRSFWTGKGVTAQLVTEPDSKTQLNAFALVMAHMEGEPVKRIIHQHLNAGNSGVDPAQALQDSPALLEAVQRTVNNALYKSQPGARSKAAAQARKEQAALVVENLD